MTLIMVFRNTGCYNVRQKFLKISTLIGENKKEKLPMTAIMKKLD
jgi:hypothetical protein